MYSIEATAVPRFRTKKQSAKSPCSMIRDPRSKSSSVTDFSNFLTCTKHIQRIRPHSRHRWPDQSLRLALNFKRRSFDDHPA